jgi:outer membrane protein OmpA-like peptidoglycan-associated protein
LAKRGVGSQVSGAEGYGSQYAKYPATASEEERALDRHVSVSVRK